MYDACDSKSEKHMQYQIRKRENVTCYLASEIVELDDEAFRKLEDNPYTGSSPQEFLKYIAELDISSGTPYDLDDSQAEALQKIKGDEVTMAEFSNSAQKFEDSWLELGQKDEEYVKYGGFKTEVSSNEEH